MVDVGRLAATPITLVWIGVVAKVFRGSLIGIDHGFTSAQSAHRNAPRG